MNPIDYIICVVLGFGIVSIIMLIFVGCLKSYQAFHRWRNPWKEMEDFLEKGLK